MTRLPPRARLRGAIEAAARAIREERWAIACGLAAVALAIVIFSAAGQDDTYITYWPAKTLAERGAILNYNGARVEQSSTLTLVFWLALVYKLTPFSMIAAGYVSSLAFGVVTLALAARVARLAGLPRPHLVAPAIGSVACVLYWSTSGMEITLVTTLELWLVLALSRLAAGARDPRSLGVALFVAVAFAASRPEAPLLLAAAVGALGVALPYASAWPARASHPPREPESPDSGRAPSPAPLAPRPAASSAPEGVASEPPPPASAPSASTPSAARASHPSEAPPSARPSPVPPSARLGSAPSLRPSAPSLAPAPGLLSWAAFARIAAVAAGAVVIVLAFRRAYFGAWVPNPASMKAPGFDLEGGLFYLWRAFAANGLHLLAVVVLGAGVIARRASRGRALHPAVVLIAALAVAHLGFIVVSGGDWMSSSRFLAPAVPSIVLTGFLAAAPLLEASRHQNAAVALFTTVNLLNTLQVLHSGEGEGRPLWTTGQLSELLERRIGPHSFSPIELGNKLHLRDAVPLQKFLRIVERAQAQSDRPLWVMTGQAGMMGYHLMSRHFGRVKMMDLWSLTTRELHDCMPADLAPGSKWGSAIVLENAFRVLQQDGARCGLELPEFYYNECPSPDRRASLKKYGYVIMYEQQGFVRHSRRPKFFPGQIEACGYFAVRSDVADRLGLKPEPVWDWNIVPR